MLNYQKCGIIGCGFVGAATAFSLVQSNLFNEIVLLDANKAKAEGEAMDLVHGISFVGPMDVYAGDYKDLADCGLVIITAGAGQTPGQTRIDLVNKNVEIFKQIIPSITKYNKECILLIVSNPVDILTYVTMKLSGFPANRVFGSGTVLDTSRLKYILSEHFSVDARNVHAFIIGEHGDSELPVWSSANVSGIDLTHFCDLCGKCQDKSELKSMFEYVKNSAYKVIEAKGATYYAIALAVTKICESIVKDQHSVLPVSCYLDNHYGLDNICLGVPAIVGKSGVQQVLDIPLDKEENAALQKSAEFIQSVIKDLKF